MHEVDPTVVIVTSACSLEQCLKNCLVVRRQSVGGLLVDCWSLRLGHIVHGETALVSDSWHVSETTEHSLDERVEHSWLTKHFSLMLTDPAEHPGNTFTNLGISILQEAPQTWQRLLNNNLKSLS